MFAPKTTKMFLKTTNKDAYLIGMVDLLAPPESDAFPATPSPSAEGCERGKEIMELGAHRRGDSSNRPDDEGSCM